MSVFMRNDQLWDQEVKGQGHTRPKIDLEVSLLTLLYRVAFVVYEISLLLHCVVLITVSTF